MKKILLMCMGGFSTGLLVEKMKAAASDAGIEVEIKAIAASALAGVANDYDVLLIAPQISYMEPEVAQKYPDLPRYLIEPVDYGRLAGKKVLAEALKVAR